MAYVADLHIHSRFSRACSQQLNIPNLIEWANLKGINLLGTGDFLHPLWLLELKNQLKEDGSGFLTHNSSDIKFLLTVEIASIYSQGGRGRRIHNLVFMPDFQSAEKFQKALLGKRATLASDGRPIVGIPSKDLLKMALEASEQAIFIPAHCLPPDEMIHTKGGMKRIEDIRVGDLVYTHNNRSKRVTEILKHDFEGDMYNIKPWYFTMGTKATNEHPFYAYKVAYCPTTGDCCLPTPAHKKVCKHKLYEKYSPTWITAEKLEEGDILVYPRFKNTTPLLNLSLAQFSNLPAKNGYIFTGGSRGYVFPEKIVINEEFGRLVGYYLAEGYIYGRDGIGFVFHEDETEYAQDVIELMRKIFGIDKYRIYRRKNVKSIELSFSSKLLTKLFTELFYTNPPFRANTKTIPDWMLHLSPPIQAEVLRGWWRGDGGYTVSRQLMNALKVICLRLGVIPSISKDTKEKHLSRGNHKYQDRVIQSKNDCYVFTRLAFFEKRNLLDDPVFKKSIRKISRRHGWIDENYIYIPIRKIEKFIFKGEVFNLEVEEDNSYLTEFSAVHNCWTPWFGIFGSESGYDSLEECFEEMTPYIYGIETGLSSDPAMNWRIKELDSRSIISFSDAHSLPNLGREATVFGGDISYGYKGLFEDIKNQKVAGTIEFYPEEGKYHYTGHRNCNVKYSPDETKKMGKICPKCGRGLTVGVMERVEAVAGRSNEELKIENTEGLIKSKSFPQRAGYRMLVPLNQIIAEAVGVAKTSQKVETEYKKLVSALGGEIKVLTKADLSEISRISGSKIAEGVDKDRRGDLVIDPGYDGVYGVVKIWQSEEDSGSEDKKEIPQLGLFDLRD